MKVGDYVITVTNDYYEHGLPVGCPGIVYRLNDDGTIFFRAGLGTGPIWQVRADAVEPARIGD